MKQIFHPYTLWEDYKADFYGNAGPNKIELSKKVVELFCDGELTEQYMTLAIESWPYSMEHNLTNPQINQIAYLGQAACCLYCGASAIVTMQTWRNVPEINRKIADQIAEELIKNWKLKHGQDAAE